MYLVVLLKKKLNVNSKNEIGCFLGGKQTWVKVKIGVLIKVVISIIKSIAIFKFIQTLVVSKENFEKFYKDFSLKMIIGKKINFSK